MEGKSFTRITLALDIIGKLSQGPFKGYHELNIIKHQIELYDEIRITPSKTMEISSNSPEVPVDTSNICWQAAEQLQKKFNISDSVHIHIEKNIPVQGGLAGGSSNGALTIMLLNKLWDLNMTTDEMITVGRVIGMDVPFYFYGQTAFDSEATGHLYPIDNKKKYTFVIVMPPFGVSTKDAYKNINYNIIGTQKDLTAKIEKGLKNSIAPQDLGLLLHNDFEQSVFVTHPKLREIKKQLLDIGALGAVMSGSGSTMIALVENETHGKEIIKKIPYDTLIHESYLKPQKI